MKQVDAANSKLHSSTSGVSMSLGGLTTILAGLTTGVAAFIGVMGAMSVKSANLAMEFERFTATIGGGLGSLDKGKEVMSALEAYALKYEVHLDKRRGLDTLRGEVVSLIEQFGAR